MSLLLDTHALIWWFTDDVRLGREADRRIRDAERVYVSAVSGYEITQKHRLGKLPQVERLALNFENEVAEEGFLPLPINIPEAALAGRMEGAHRDPFDRLLIAQGLLNGLTIVSNDTVFDAFGVGRVW